ncbi:MAG: hypothetical protein M3Y78_09995 [Pseudomonadota bacterium]|nr:hypothetical protein [Pseudomonadota bacterium]
MILRLMWALCIVLLAGCTSSEPQNVPYAPLVDAAAPMPAPPPTPALLDQTEQFPPSDAEPATAYQPGCHTVDNVTLCDAPSDPSVDDTLYTN